MCSSSFNSQTSHSLRNNTPTHSHSYAHIELIRIQRSAQGALRIHFRCSSFEPCDKRQSTLYSPLSQVNWYGRFATTYHSDLSLALSLSFARLFFYLFDHNSHLMFVDSTFANNKNRMEEKGIMYGAHKNAIGIMWMAK